MNPNEVMNQIESAWQLVNEGHLQEARARSEKLVREIHSKLETTDAGEQALLQGLAGACHVAGYTVNLSVRSPYAAAASRYFDEILHTARQLRDTSLCVRALSYRGDLARRYGDPQKALRSLQLAYRIGPVDPVAHGTSTHLLARLSREIGEMEQFQQLMQEAEHIAETLLPDVGNRPGQFCLGNLFLEYSFSCRHQGKFQQGMDYLAQAEKALPDTPYWQTELGVVRGLLLVHSGKLEEGMPHVKSVAKLAKEQGNQMLLEEITSLRRFLGSRCLAYNEANTELGEALHGCF